MQAGDMRLWGRGWHGEEEETQGDDLLGLAKDARRIIWKSRGVPTLAWDRSCGRLQASPKDCGQLTPAQ